MHTAGVHILNSEGHEVWIDVRATAVPLGRLVEPAFREAERANRARVRPPSLPHHGCP